MRKFKGFISLLLILVTISVGFVGCKKKHKDSENNNTVSNSDTTVDSSEKVNYDINYAQDFSNGTAWIKNNNSVMLIDTKGSLLYQEITTDASIYELGDNTSCIEVRSNEIPQHRYIFVNKKTGNVLSTYTSDDFDSVLSVGGGYAVFQKEKSTIDESQHYLIVIDSNGKMLGKTNPVPKISGKKLNITKQEYVGKGYFYICVQYSNSNSQKNYKQYIFDAKINKYIELPNKSLYNRNFCSTNYYEFYKDDGCYTITDNGELKKLGYEDYDCIEQNMLCKVTTDNKLKVHNLDTGKEYTFSKYKVTYVKGLDDGKLLVELNGENDQKYYTVLDTNGNITFEPLKGKVDPNGKIDNSGFNHTTGKSDMAIKIDSKIYLVPSVSSVLSGSTDKKAVVIEYYKHNGLGTIELVDLTTGRVDTDFTSTQMYDSVGQFHDGLAWVKDANEKYHYIDRFGNIVI